MSTNSSSTIASVKEQLREKSKYIRSSLCGETCQCASTAICDHIENWNVFQNSQTILTYLPMGNEVDLTALLERQAHKRWAIPRILPGYQMAFHLYNPSNLIFHDYGMWEPAPDCSVIAPEEIDLALVPGLTFDLQGWRLGFGGGFYDRFLCDFTGVALGITYQSLLIEHVPHGAYDIPIRFVVTEEGIHEMMR